MENKEEKQIVPAQPITLDPTSLGKAKEWEDFVSLWMVSKEIDQFNQWFKGDIADRLTILYGENSLKKFAQDVDENVVSIEHYRRVARAFPIGKRGLNLSWTHYFIASFTDSYKKGSNHFFGRERFNWVDKAHDERWSTTRLAQEIKKAKALVDDRVSIFDYYNSYLTKVKNILLHIEIARLSKEEAANLLNKLEEIKKEFQEYIANL